MDQIPQALLFLGIIPSLILLYISLKGYDGYYKDKIVFITFIVGLIIGFISILIEYYTAGVYIFFIILFPLLEQLFKTIFLNLPRFHGKKETTIYGLSLGLGFGSIYISSSLILLNIQGTSNNFSTVVTILGSFGFILIHGATGLLIGFGVYIYSLFKYLIFSILIYLPVTILFYVSTEIIKIGYLQLAIVPYGLIIYWYMTKKLMPKIKNEPEKRKRTKK
jgi:hypothetical protein